MSSRSMKAAIVKWVLVIVAGCYQCIGAPGDFERGTEFCGAWKTCDVNASECQCAQFRNLHLVKECHSNYTLLSKGACATFYKQSKATLVGLCPFDVHETFFGKFSSVITAKNINLTSFECDPLNRTGLLCGQCKPGLGPALLNYSHPCLECTSYGWLAYFAATLIPATLFFIVIVVFHIDATSPSLTFFILYVHLLLAVFQRNPNFFKALKGYVLYKQAVPFFAFVLTCCSIWNLDFFRLLLPSFCASSEMSMLSVLALEYVVAVYPLVFTALVYTVIELHASGNRVLVFLWRPFHAVFYRFHKLCDIRGSVINAFTTFICLSYSKILSTSVNILSYTQIISNIDSSFSSRKFLYFNATVPYGDSGNIPYFVLAVMMPTVLCILPLMTLIFFHTRLCMCFHRHRLICEVVKVFQKHFKDGTSGTCDYRFFAGFYFTLRLIFFLIYFTSYRIWSYAFWFLSFIAAILISYAHPYKEKIYNRLDSFWFAQLVANLMAVQYQETSGDSVISFIILCVGNALPLLYINFLAMYVVVKMTTRGRLKHCLVKCCCCCFKKRVSEASFDDQLPHRIFNSIEYRPLLQK